MGRSDFLHPTLRKEREGWGTLIAMAGEGGTPAGIWFGQPGELVDSLCTWQEALWYVSGTSCILDQELRLRTAAIL
jgi:hypothetical protein